MLRLKNEPPPIPRIAYNYNHFHVQNRTVEKKKKEKLHDWRWIEFQSRKTGESKDEIKGTVNIVLWAILKINENSL